MTHDEKEALERFIKSVRSHYDSSLYDVVVFGSRARGDHRADSDVDLAIILEGLAWDFWDEKLRLVDMSDDAFFEHGLLIQAWPIAKSSWLDPSLHYNPRFIRSIRRDARPVSEAA